MQVKTLVHTAIREFGHRYGVRLALWEQLDVIRVLYDKAPELARQDPLLRAVGLGRDQ